MELGRAMKEPLSVESLSRDEQLDLLERLWDSLSATPEDVPVTKGQRTELDRRSRALDRDLRSGKAPLGVPWDEVVRQLRARR